MGSVLTPLTDLGMPELIEFDNKSMVDELIAHIKANPEWAQQWDGELTQNASFAFINYFAFLAMKNAEGSNRRLREAFITKARDPNSVIDHMADFGESLQQNTAASVNLTGTIVSGALTQKLVIASATSIPATDLDGKSTAFEIMVRDTVYPDKIDYGADTVIDPGVDSFKCEAFAGTTFAIDLTLNPPFDCEKFKYTISKKDIIEGSIRIYFEWGNPFLQTELLVTDSFAVAPIGVSPTFPNGTPRFIIESFSDGSAAIMFGTKAAGGSFPTSAPSRIRIWGRTGGGKSSNVSIGSINERLKFNINQFNTVQVQFVNDEDAAGGSDREDINIAQQYAPHRIGRGKGLVDDQDILNALRTMTIKHRVDSPKYSEIGNKIPLLHYHNYVAPRRNFTNFVFPTPGGSDTVSTYQTKFLAAMNDFLNLQKIHDQVVTDEVMSLFSATNFSHDIFLKPVLNGTLMISAFDEAGTEIDQLTFSSNYQGTNNSPDAFQNRAQARTTAPVGAVVVNGLNNKLRLVIDQGAPGPGLGTYIDLTIPSGLYGTTGVQNLTLAAAIDTQIRASNVYYSSFPVSHKFCYCLGDGTIVIESGIVGQYSYVEVKSSSNDIRSTMGLPVQVHRANPQSGLVFTQATLFDYISNKINVALNTSRFAKNLTFNPAPFTWPDTNQPTGPAFVIPLFKEDNVTKSLPQIGLDVTVQAYNSSNSLIDEIKFSSVQNVTNNVAVVTISGNGSVFKIASPNTVLDYPAAHVKIQLQSGVGGPTYTFPPAYDGNTYFKVIYQEKTYKFTTCTYRPNPYFNEGETATLAAILRGEGERILVEEPIMKRVDFRPIKISGVVQVKPGSSPNSTVQTCTDIVKSFFGYDNSTPEMNIGLGFPTSTCLSFLNDSNNLNKGVKKVTLSSPTDDIVDTSTNSNQYWFVLPDEIIEGLIKIEQAYPQVEGISALYSVDMVLA